MKNIKVVVPAGLYYLGDPCYVFSEEDWGKILKNNPSINFVYEIEKGQRFLMFSVGGDGLFSDLSGKTYSVDTGTIGLVPAQFIDQRYLQGVESGTIKSQIVTFNEPTLCKYIDGEFLSFGTVVFDLTYLDFEYEKEFEGKDYWQIWE